LPLAPDLSLELGDERENTHHKFVAAKPSSAMWRGVGELDEFFNQPHERSRLLLPQRDAMHGDI
jgi:hypothetical protein